MILDIAYIWNSTSEERQRNFPCDRYISNSDSGETVFDKIAVTYAIIPVTNNTCRLVVKLQVIYPKRNFWSLMRWGLPWGDMIMMRKQLLNLKKLAEKQTVG
jgi:hypothetical protein